MKIIFWSLLFCNLVFTQSLPIPYHYEILDKTLKDFQHDLSKSNETYSVSSVKIGGKEAPFLRVFFDDCNLGNNSYLKITSFYDGYTQILNKEKLQRWKNSSMLFNGDTLLVELYKSKYDYNVDIKISRVALKNELAISQKLGLSGERKSSFSGWLAQAKQFYLNAIDDPTVIAKLSVFGITQTKLEAGKALVEETETKNAVQEKEKGEAQQATLERDKGADQLFEWVADFIVIARIALEGKPQLLEKLGIVEPS